MSPERNGLSRSQLSASKPYVRKLSSKALSSATPPSPLGLLGLHDTPPPSTADAALRSMTTTPVERAGFPTYSQYKQIECNYIDSLTPRRQGKALISQSMFDRIWDVLHHPESQMETAQFRFWARKMFTVCKDYRITLGIPDGMEAPPQEVLLHDNLLVAIQEQLYDLLCYCHGSTGHGGRDKTCALIRKHYTWVPKDLVSNFIKACPTCIMKKCGNVDVTSSHIPQLIAEADKVSAQFINQHDSLNRVGGGSNHSHSKHVASSPGYGHGGHPYSHHDLILDSPFEKVSTQIGLTGDASNSILQPLLHQPLPHIATPTALSWTTTTTSFGSFHSPHLAHNMHHRHPHSPIDDSITHSSFTTKHSASSASGDENTTPFPVHPMVREVPLFKGLPNGWQYHHDDFETAHSEFMLQYKRTWGEVGGDIIPDDSSPDHRVVPGIAGLWTPEHFREVDGVKEEVDDHLDMLYSNAILDGRGQLRASQFKHFQNQEFIFPPMSHALDVSDQNILRGMGTPHLSHEWSDIDPALIGLSTSGPFSVINTSANADRMDPTASLSSSTSGSLNYSYPVVAPTLQFNLGNTADAFQKLVDSNVSNEVSWQEVGVDGTVASSENKSPTNSVESHSSSDSTESKQSPIFDLAGGASSDTSNTTTPEDESEEQTKSELKKTIAAVTQALVDHQAQQISTAVGLIPSESFESIGSVEASFVGQAVGA